MDKKIRNKWVKALRSGKYKQGTGALVSPGNGQKKDRFCCLGVLCAITKKDMELADTGGFSYRGEYECGNLPRNFQEEIGLSDEQQKKLIAMNDITNDSFKRIATYIEKNL